MFSSYFLVTITLLLLAALQQAQAQQAYCLSGGPSISWPSSSQSYIQRISLAEAGVRLVLTPQIPDENGDSIRVSLQTSSPYHTAVLRIGLEGTIVPNSSESTAATTTILDCGNGAVGMTNNGRSTVEGTFVASRYRTMLTRLPLPLRFDMTVVVSRTPSDDGHGLAVVYAYEKIFLEEWMLMDSSVENQIVGQTNGVDVRVVNNYGDDNSVLFDFAFQETASADVETLPKVPSWNKELLGLAAATPSPTAPPTTARPTTASPTLPPTGSPTTPFPTASPSGSPTSSPSSSPTFSPTDLPTANPVTSIIRSLDLMTAGNGPGNGPSVVLVPNLQSGAVIHLRTTGTALSMVAQIDHSSVHDDDDDDDVFRVSFAYDDHEWREGQEPYAMAGNSGDRNYPVAYLSTPGPKTVIVRVLDASKNVLDSVSCTFKVIEN